MEKLVGKRFVEGWGLQHMKIYGGDDEVIISGANLSNDYFTNRRDRYMRLQDKSLSKYMYTLLMIAARYSYRLDAVSCGVEEKDRDHAPYQVSWDEGRELPLSTNLAEHGPKRWKEAMKHDIEGMTAKWHGEKLSTFSTSNNDEVIQVVPLLQMGRLGIRQETECVPLVMQEADHPSARLDFTTGYFSINPQYASRILKGKFKSNMITASPKANGFYGSRGISGHLPAAYTWLESRFWADLKAAQRDGQVTVREWYKSGWTYHAKGEYRRARRRRVVRSNSAHSHISDVFTGIWLYPPGKDRPSASLLGSSNFGTRSASLDLECTLLIDAVGSPSMQQRLGQEVKELAKDANDAVGDAMFAREERKVHWGVKVAAWFIKKML
jgi:CDP-diacylglycerol--glycerol-3-phosphate 3-phosphatidyltransferase